MVRTKLLTLTSSVLVLTASQLPAQRLPASRDGSPKAEVFVGYAYLSSGFAGRDSVLPSNRHLNGISVTGAGRLIAGLSLKVDVTGYYGSSNYIDPLSSVSISSSPQHALFFLAGPQYSHSVHRERLFVEGLIGTRHLNQDYSVGLYPSGNSLAYTLGGGVDTPLTRRVALRVQGAFLHANETPHNNQFHYFPTAFARASTGILLHF